MKVLIFVCLFCVTIVAMAQAPATAPVATSSTTITTVPASSGSLFSPAVIAAVVSIVVCLNIALSAVQQIFSKLGKGEPSVLQQISSVVAKVAQYLGSNPNV